MNWNDLKVKFDTMLGCVRRNEIIFNICFPPAQLKMTRPMYFIFFRKKIVWNKKIRWNIIGQSIPKIKKKIIAAWHVNYRLIPVTFVIIGIWMTVFIKS